jgi:uncharacterized alpha-E superfamily protein
MLSRVADSIYWMSRYIERAENLARFIDVTFNLMLDMPANSNEPWQPLIQASGDHERFAEEYGQATQENVLKFLTFDESYPNSILRCLYSARENARSIREVISSEMWEQLNLFYHNVRNAAQSKDQILNSPIEFFQEIKLASHLFKGITDSTMSRGEGWNFSRLGRLLERADKTSRILDVKYYILLPNVSDVGTPTDDLQWQAVLRSVSGIEMFRQKYHGITPQRVVQFLLTDRQFPRAIHYAIVQAERALHNIAGTPLDSYRSSAERRLGMLRSEFSFAEVQQIINNGLHEFIDELQQKLNDIDDAIHETFIEMRPVTAAEEVTAGQTQSQG